MNTNISFDLDTGIHIPNNYKFIDAIKSSLTANIPDNDGVYHIHYFFIEGETGILIPRCYNKIPEECSIVDNRVDGDTIDIQSNIVLRSEGQRQSYEFFLSNYNGVLQLEPGRGKTYIAIHTICAIKKKTIIFVHNYKLQKQWVEHILKTTNLVESDIGLLTKSNYKKALTKPIILSTVQSVGCGKGNIDKTNKFKNALKTSGIGVAFFDECHTTVGPDKFSLASCSINCKRVYGLSATPYRFHFTEIINYHLGDIFYYPPEKDEMLHPDIYMMYFPFNVLSGKLYPYICYGGTVNYSRYYKSLVKSKSFLQKCASIIKSAFNKGRKILVITHHVQPLIDVAKQCNLPKKHIGIFCPSASDDIVLTVSDTADGDIAFDTKDIVFTTYKSGRDGLSRLDFDCLIMLTPTSNVNQCIGRICRVMEGKKTPIVIDLVDTQGPMVTSVFSGNTIPFFYKGAEKRSFFYNERNYKIKYTDITNLYVD